MCRFIEKSLNETLIVIQYNILIKYNLVKI